MKIVYYDGTIETCEKIEFCYDRKRIIVNECTPRPIEDILCIVNDRTREAKA